MNAGLRTQDDNGNVILIAAGGIELLTNQWAGGADPMS